MKNYQVASSGLLFAMAVVLALALIKIPATNNYNKITHSALKVAFLEKKSPSIYNSNPFNPTVIYNAFDGLKTMPAPPATYTLPVVVHIVNNDPSSIADKVITDAIQDLNDAFGKTGAYSAGKGVDTKIRFCLAQKDPDGGNSMGITRTEYFFADDFNPAIEDDRLKALIQWDPQRYINIWYVVNMHHETSASFTCGNWTRSSESGYATTPQYAGGTLDGIVVTGFGASLTHEMGIYLGLFNTFQGGCTNNNCKTDGDQVCDTPPEAYPTSTTACNISVNTCSSDTSSGFTTDMPDPTANFMDGGNSACHNEFTAGQAEKMQTTITTQRAGLLQDECDKPCANTFVAAFTKSNAYPLPGDNINFTNTSGGGATNYQWLVNGAIVSTSKNFSYSFNDTGQFKVTLKAYTTDPTCFAAYTDYVKVTCGVTARFYTDKQHIASKAPAYLDSIVFNNTSVNATSFKWLVANDQGMAEKQVSTQKNLAYFFSTPANYTIRLIATNGSCTDTTETYPVTVDDPTPDGVGSFATVDCYQQAKIKIDLHICNNGYAPIPPGIPISFYDADPRLGNAHRLSPSFILPDTIQGKCCGSEYSHILDVGKTGVNVLYMVFNDSGTTMPLQLPNTPFKELDYTNNIQSDTAFQFHVSVKPLLSSSEPGDTVQLVASAGPGTVSSYLWSSGYDLSCTSCAATNLIADTAITKQVIAASVYGCTDTAYSTIKIPPYNDFTVAVNDIECAGTDSLYVNFTISNSFKRGVIPQGLTVAWYNGPATSTASLLPPLFSVLDTVKLKQATFSAFIKATSPGNIYAVVNDSGTTSPLQLPNVVHLPEKDYTNNDTSYNYQLATMLLLPADTTVLRKSSFTYNILSPLVDPASTVWDSGANYTLSCYDCVTPVATIFNVDTVIMHTANKFGCMLEGEAVVKIIAPDITVQLLSTDCYTNDSTLAVFKICMNNNYDTVFAGLPVAFYDADPSEGSANLLSPVFYTKQATAGSCDTFFCIVTTPPTHHLYASVNDKGHPGTPTRVFDETDYTNNTDTAAIVPFTATIMPTDTSIAYGESVVLNIQASGFIGSILWQPTDYLSCTGCTTTTVTPQYSTNYSTIMRNKYFCVDTAYSVVKIFRGPDVSIPSAFTPNGDGRNDVFYVFGGKDAAVIKNFAVYNRWGNMVFHVNNAIPNTPAYGWDGNVNGIQAETGTYVYMVTMQFADGSQKNYKGTVVLVR